ncbi:hypothetical protein ASPBRDRAFT_139561 [Aspergillus brasiliensis CBS 101740]|uniref:Fe2OG dioxygenase domain-containing protein n=1 Tax=Aspergillus brasiliensis (strain CBS 101740 / IMI 381727 / IBT 21946) TaxID=767769 RepID=A0A1L9U219_ASPBC|nr:hypothetical protein ASPBRDRAFT_139561 [Aspergillus brasiliensis CBS 101740]
MATPRPAEYRDVPTADLSTIQFIKLFDKDQSELKKLITACENDGFFYLDLQHGGSETFWSDLFEIDSITKKWFSQPEHVKLMTPTVSLSHGFKAIGNQSGAVQSLKDGFEALKIGKFELDGRWALPSVAQDNLALFDQFTAACHFISKLLLDCISDELGLKGDARLETHHRDDCRSKSTLYFLHYPPSVTDPNKVGQNMHTDIGSLTILHAPQWGLQVFSPDDATWKYVVPRPGHAIVNVGDTLRFLSNKRLRSALHRVLPQGRVQTEDRYSISYFLRASDSTEFEDSNGDDSSAKQWYLKKYEMYELPHAIQKEHTTLSGGMAQELQATF